MTTVRWFLYGLVMVFTMGKVQFWILPNLENDKCGFFASFVPLYSIERHIKSVKKSSKKKKVSDDSSEPKESGSEKGKEKEKESDPSASDHEDEGDSEEQEINTEASS